MKLVIFGVGELAEVAHYYFAHEAGRSIAAFTVDDAYMDRDTVAGVPVVPWSEVSRRFPADQHDVFVAIGYSRVNALRADRVAAVSTAGYRLASFLHSRAVVWDGFVLRENTFILEHNTLQPFVQVGRNVIIWSGNHIGHHSVVEDGCYLASHAVISGGVQIGQESFVGVNVTIRDHVTVGRRCVLGAGVVVLSHLPDESVLAATATPVSRVPSRRLRHI